MNMRAKVFLLMLCFGALKWVFSARVPNSAVEFNFLRSQCLINSFPSLTSGILGSFIKKNSSVECPGSNGLLGGTFVASQNDVTNLAKAMGNRSYTIDMWIQPQLKSTDFSQIVVVGSELGVVLKSCGSNLMISQRTSTISSTEANIDFQVTFCTLNQGYTRESIKPFTSPTFKVPAYNKVPAITHVTFTITMSGHLNLLMTVTFTVNGDATTASTSDSFDQNWNQYWAHWSWNPSYKLLLMDPFSTPQGSKLWSGSVYYFALYINKALSSAEVLQNYQAGLPNSPVVALSKTVLVQQNGEIGDHSNDPAFYKTPIVNTNLAVIALPVSDLDDSPISPNYKEGTKSTVVITSLPSKGQLYFPDGTEIKTVGSGVVVPFNKTLSAYGLRYRPTLNEYSYPSSAVFSSVAYYAVDGITKQRSDGTLSIIVTHVDQPPVAIFTNKPDGIASKMQIIQLFATDVDSALIGGTITQLPANGKLYHMTADFQTANLSRPITKAGTFVKAKMYPRTEEEDADQLIYVGYIYTKENQMPMGGGDTEHWRKPSYITEDSFYFTARDAEGRNSLPSEHMITLNTALVATPNTASNYVIECKPSSVKVGINDTADKPRRLTLKIVKLPLNGLLYDDYSKMPLKVGDMTQIVLSSDVYDYAAVRYESPPGYWNTPSTSLNGTVLSTGPDSFDYVACVPNKIMNPTACLAESVKVTQQVLVRRVNTPVRIFFDTLSADGSGGSTITIRATKSGSTTKPSAADGTMVTLSGFRLVDDDKGIDKIRATVQTTAGGLLSLNPSAFSHIDIMCPEQRSWKCEGDGTSDTLMTFIGTPWDVQQALRGMTYHSETQKIQDKITVTLYDGQDFECLDDASQTSRAYRDECFKVTYDLPIEVLSFLDGAPSDGSSESSSSGGGAKFTKTMQYAALAVIVVVFLTGVNIFWKWLNNDLPWTKTPAQREYARYEAEEKRKEAIAKQERAARKQQQLQRQHSSTARNARNASAGRSKSSKSNAINSPTAGRSSRRVPLDDYPADSSSSGDSEAQRLEAELRRLDRKNMRAKAKLQAKLQMRTSTAEMVSYEQEQQDIADDFYDMAPAYSSPPRTAPAQQQQNANGGFRNQAEYYRHMAAVEEENRRAAAAQQQNFSSTQRPNAHTPWTPPSTGRGNIRAPSGAVYSQQQQQQQQQRAAPGPLNLEMPAVWTAHKSPKGKMYYYNRITQESVWNKPVGFM